MKTKTEKLLWNSIPNNKYKNPRPSVVITRMVADGLMEFTEGWEILRKWVAQGRYDYNPNGSLDMGWKVRFWRSKRLMRYFMGAD